MSRDYTRIFVQPIMLYATNNPTRIKQLASISQINSFHILRYVLVYMQLYTVSTVGNSVYKLLLTLYMHIQIYSTYDSVPIILNNTSGLRITGLNFMQRYEHLMYGTEERFSIEGKCTMINHSQAWLRGHKTQSRSLFFLSQFVQKEYVSGKLIL